MPDLLYLFETNLDKAKAIIDVVSGNEYQIELVSELPQLRKFIQHSTPSAIFIGYEWLHLMIDDLRFMREYPTLIYGEQIDSADRIRLYQRGAVQVIDLRDGEEKVLFQIFEMLRYRQNELKNRIIKHVTKGSVENIDLKELLLKSIVERKNLIIKIHDEDWLAKIRLFQGQIVEAVSPGKQGVEAILDVLWRQNGKFRMRSYQKSQEVCTIGASTFALLAEAELESQELKKFLAKFGNNYPILEIANHKNENSIETNEQRLFQLIEKQKNFRSVIAQSPFGLLFTIRLTDSLLERKLLMVSEKERTAEGFSDEDIHYIKNHLFSSGMKEGRLLLFAFPGPEKSQLIQTLAAVQNTQVKTVESVDLTQVQLASDLRLHVIGISIDAHFQKIMQKLAGNMLASVFIIDAQKTDKYEYLKYLIYQFLTTYSVPVVFAVIHIPEDSTTFMREIKTKLEIPKELELMPLDVNDFASIRELFYHLKNYFP